jgi:tape measure domain-containing protein
MAFTIPTIFTAVDKISSTLMSMGKKISSFAKDADKQIRNIGSAADGVFKKLTGGMGDIAIAGAIGLATYGVTKFVQEASKVEDATAAFTPLLGSVENATSMVKALNIAAAETPFQFDALASSANTLLGFGAATQKDVIPVMKMLGDLSQGNAEKLGRISVAFGQIKAAGKANLGDINQLINNGVPILGELAKMWHTTVGKARQAVEDGKGSSEDLTRAFQRMTSKGGMFFNGMAIASQTFSGKMSTLMDNINLTFAAIGNEMLPILKEYVDQISAAAEKVKLWVANNKDLIKDKVRSFFEKVNKSVKFLVENFDSVVKYLKIFAALLVFVKTISFAVAVYEAVASIIAFGVAVWGGVAAMWAYVAAAWAAVAPTLAFLWPILLIIAALGLLVFVVTKVLKNWNDWGAAVTLLGGIIAAFFAPVIAGFLFLISLVSSFARNWDMIKDAFANKGILAGLKAIGATILDAVLMPLQQVLKVIAKLTGFEWASNAVQGIEALRNGLGVVTGEQGTNETKPVNPDATKQEVLSQQINSVQTNNAQVNLNINDPKNRTSSTVKDPFGIIKLTSTMAQ